MISRRDWLGTSLGAGAALALTPQLLRALQALQQPGGTLIQRAIPSTGEMLPVIGLQLQNNTSQDPAVRKEILKTLVDNGGRFFDTVLQSQPGVEDLLAKAVTELEIQNRLFLGLRGAAPGPQQADPAGAAKGQIEALLAKFRVPKLDLVQLGSNGHPSMFAALKEAKQEGRVRHIGATAIVPSRYPLLEALIRSDSVDFISVDYSVDRRRAEETLLPLAQERKIGVVAYFPFGINSGSLFRRVGTTPLPAWAAEFDARTWAQFFIKYVVSHPAVTVVCTSTSKATHMLDNIGGGIGRLPDEATRKRMAAFIDALPALPARPQDLAAAPGIALPAAILDRYVGEWKLPSGAAVTFRRSGARLIVKPGTGGELPLNARSETRLQDPRGPVFEFQVDAGGTVTGLVQEQGNPVQRIPLTRK